MPRNRYNGFRPKAFQNILIETALFVSMFAVVGHLGVNFWERYVIQGELTKMKTSLNSMKDTINFIGDAYDNLHKEMVILTEITEEPNNPFQQKQPKAMQQDKSTLDRRTLHDLQVQATVRDRNDREVYAVPITTNRTTDSMFYHNRDGKKSKSTIANIPQELAKHKEINDVLVGTSIHHGMKHVGVNKVSYGKNATTITRYPLKSTGVGEDISMQWENQSNKKCRHTHHCQNNAVQCALSNFSCPHNFWQF